MHKNNNRFARNCQRHRQLMHFHTLTPRLKTLRLIISALFAPSLFMQSLYAHETIDNTNATANTATKVETREETTAATSQLVTLPSVASQYGVS
ncbi:MAG: hypothetical protein ABL859_11240, partial [Methylotenera sp.]